MPESNCSRSFNKFNERSNLERILCWFADKTLNPKLLVAPVRSCLDLDDLYDTLTLNRNSHTYILTELFHIAMFNAVVIGLGRMGDIYSAQCAQRFSSCCLPLAHAESIELHPNFILSWSL